jgi:hypothetical protein
MKVSKKKLAASLAVGAIAVTAGGVAYAYFTGGSASDSGSASVGQDTTWSVSSTLDDSNGPLYPGGASSEEVDYTVTNTGSGVQHLASAGVSIDDDSVAQDGSGNVLDANNPDTDGNPQPAVGCLASWFDVDNALAAAAGEVDPTDDTPGSAVITLKDINDTQNDCKGVAPAYTVSASG